MPALLHVLGVLALFAAAARHRQLSGRARWIAWSAGPLLIAGALLATGDTFVVLKWLPRLVMPIGLIWLALSALACWQLMRGRPLGRWLVALSLGLWISACNPLASYCVGRLEAGYRLPPSDVHFDAVLVLGGGTSLGPDGPQVSPCGDRVVTVARLYHRGMVERVVVGGHVVAALDPRGRPRLLGDQTRFILMELGVPAETIVVLPGARNTREETAAFSQLVSQRGLKHVGLLTSAWHLPRAMLHARRAGLDATPIPADFRSHPPAFNIVGILPSLAGANNMRIAAWEALGITLRR